MIPLGKHGANISVTDPIGVVRNVALIPLGAGRIIITTEN